MMHMLQLSAYVYNRPVLSLRTGGQVATAIAPVVNMKNLKIEGFYCEDSVEKKQLILLSQDIREPARRGFIIDDYDVLAELDDLVRLHDVLAQGFDLLKKPVETVSREKIGKVADYATEMNTLYIQKLYVSQPIWKNLTGGSLSVDRTQVHDVTPKRIVINDLLQPTPTPATAVAA
jgi:hypothetical protein